MTVVGAARSGSPPRSCSRGAAHGHAVRDARRGRRTPSRFARLGVQLELGGHKTETFTSADLVVLSPGVPPEQPVVRRRAARGVPVVGEIELASRWLQGRVIAITGTKGKSTTTALTGRMLEAGGFNVTVGGNIGAPLSAQVDGVDAGHAARRRNEQLSARADRHVPSVDRRDAEFLARPSRSSPERSRRTPRRRRGSSRTRTRADWAVINADDPAVLELARRGRAPRGYFARRAPIAEGMVDRGRLDRRAPTAQRPSGWCRSTPFTCSDRIWSTTSWRPRPSAPSPVRRRAAMTGGGRRVSRARARDGARRRDRRRAVRQRLEGDQRRVGAAIDRKLRRGLVAIIGGRFKGGDLRLLREPLSRARQPSWRLAKRGRWCARRSRTSSTCTRPTSLEEAVEDGVRARAAGGVVLLAPACASFDMFRDYAERGRRFKEEVTDRSAE